MRRLVATSLHKTHGPGTHAPALALPAQALGSGGLYANTRCIHAERGREVRAHGFAMRANFWLLAGDGAICVHQLETTFASKIHNGCQQLERVRVFVGGVGIREQLAYVAPAHRAQDCVGKRMRQNVRVRMTQQALLMWNIHAADDAAAPSTRRWTS